MSESISADEFLDRKRDFSPLLVHLTKADETCSAKDVLKTILNERTLKAFSHFCLFSPALRDSKDDSLQKKFKVVCFTETPIDQIDVLLMEVQGRNIKPEPYGLVFKKDYIKERGGNPVFYMTKEIATPLWELYRALKGTQSPSEACKLLALVTLCDQTMDFHWEREWRIVGNLEFGLDDIYCGLCRQEDIAYFEAAYKPVRFISPYWGINKILDRLVGKQ